MQLSRYIFDMTKRLALGMLLGGLVVSCVADNSLCPEEPRDLNDGNDVWLRLSVDQQGVFGSSSPITRAGDTSDPDHQGHRGEQGTAEENAINPQDLTLVLFDANDRVMKVLPPNELINLTPGENNKNYTFLAKVNRAYFDFAAGKMSILAVANHNGIGDEIDGNDYPQLVGKDVDFSALPFQMSLSELTTQHRGFYYSGEVPNPDWDSSQAYLPDWTLDPNYTVPSMIGWRPDPSKNRYIPMSGYQKNIELGETQLAALENASTPEKAFNLPEIVMQRAMAKIRVLDGVRFQSELSKPTKITKVDLRNGTVFGTTVPDVTQTGLIAWGNEGTSIVETATKPSKEGEWHANKSTYHLDESGTFRTQDKDGVTRDFPAFTCYAPEMDVYRSDMANDKQYQPYLEILCEKQVSDTQTELKEYTVLLNKVMEEEDFVRNHIYQYYVTLNEFSAELELHVVDWEGETIEWDYTDNPSISDNGYIRWENADIDRTSATAYLKSDLSAATATFTLSTPRNATWKAVFATISGKEGAFCFVNSDDSTSDSVGGIIDGVSPIKLNIKPTSATANEMNSARLIIIVTTPDGRTMNADVLQGGGYGNNSYFTVVQNQTL